MREKLLPVLTRYWMVTGTTPSVDQKYPHYGQNVQLGVEAESLEKALEVARAQYSNITFIACHHRGDVHLKA